jgi:subtilisin family serine protease
MQSPNYQVDDISYNSTRNTWLVIWNEWAGSSFGNNVYGQLIDASGNLIGSRISIGAAAADEWGGTVSYAPAPIDRWLVTWVYIPPGLGSNGALIEGAILNGDGTFYKSPFIVDDRPNADFYPSVAYDGSKWHVSWTNLLIASTATPAQILGRFVSASGVPGAAADVQTAAALYQYTDSVAFATGHYTFLWPVGGGNPQLMARTMDVSGALSGVVTVAPAGSSIGSAQVVPGPSNKLLFVWASGSSVLGRLADGSLNFLSSPFTINGGSACSAAYSVTSGKWLVVAAGGSLQGSLVDTSGTVSPSESLAPGSSVSGVSAPRVAWNSATNQMLAIYTVFPAAGSLQNLKAVRYTIPATSPGPTTPTITITAPLNGAAVSGTVPITANATDNTGVTRVEFSAGGTLFATDTSSPYQASWDSTTVLNGTVVLTAKAYNSAGNSAAATVTATVANPNPTGPPAISSVTQSKAGPGARIRIDGANFVAPGRTTNVVFTGTASPVDGVIETRTANEIVARVPALAISGPLLVQVAGVNSNSLNFEVVLSYSTAPDPSMIVRDSSGGPLTTSTDLLVTLSDFTGFTDAGRIASKFNGQVVGYLAASNTYLMRFAAGSPAQLLTRSNNLDNEPGVVESMLRIALQPMQAADSVDKRYAADVTEGRTGIWGWDRVQAIGAWRMLNGTNLTPVKVAMLDTGVLRSHIDFAGINLTQVQASGATLTEVPYTGTDANPRAPGHGTAVAGIIGAAANGTGIDGVLAPPLANRHTLQIYESGARDVDSFYDDVMTAIERAERTGARVFNLSSEMSLEYMLQDLPPAWQSGWSPAISTHLARLLNNFRTQMMQRTGILLVVGAGNHSLSIDTNLRVFGSVNAKGSLSNVIVVGGIGLEDNRWTSGSFGSNYGSIDIAAPAHRILVPTTTTDPNAAQAEDPKNQANSEYGIVSGTSFAAPFVSGAAGLLFAINNTLTPADVKKLLTNNSLPVYVDLPGSQSQTFWTLKIGDTVSALLTQMGNQSPSWSRLYAVSTLHNNPGGGIMRFPTIVRSTTGTSSYLTQGAASPLYASYATFSNAANGRFLAAAGVDNNLGGIDERIQRVPLPAGAATVAISCGGLPALLPSQSMAFVTDQCLNTNPQTDLYMLTPTWAPKLTRIGTPTAVTASQAGGNWTAHTIPVPLPVGNFRFGTVMATPDNRWVVFTQSFGGNVYLFPTPATALQAPNLPPLAQLRAMTNPNQFLAISQNGTALANVLAPAISPDGSRIAFVDASTRALRMALLNVESRPGPYITVSTWEYTRVLDLGPQLPQGPPPYLTWSPDGSKILFSQGPDIYIISGAAGDYSGRTQKADKMVGASLTSTPTFQWAWRE